MNNANMTETEQEPQQVRSHPQADPSIAGIAGHIADVLRENERGPRAQVWRAVRFLGPDAAQALLEETQRIEAAGGQLLPDGSRRRTPGGIFFRLVKRDAPRELRWKIFPATKQQAKAKPVSALMWVERLPLIKQVRATILEDATVEITLIGRPARVIEKKACAIFGLSSTVPELPAGLPVPPATTTRYTIYVALAQWHEVKAAFDAAPDAQLQVTGHPAYDPDLEGMAVFATGIRIT